jgi:hypothetical protein
LKATTPMQELESENIIPGIQREIPNLELIDEDSWSELREIEQEVEAFQAEELINVLRDARVLPAELLDLSLVERELEIF